MARRAVRWAGARRWLTMSTETMTMLEELSATLRAFGLDGVADRLEAGEDIEEELEDELRTACSPQMGGESMRALRASALPMLMACPGAQVPPTVVPERDTTAADVGTDTHQHLAAVVIGDRVDLDDIENLEVRVLTAQGLKLWAQVRQSFPNPSVEVAFQRQLPGCDVLLTGHADIVSGFLLNDRQAVAIGDWKTGRRDSDYSEQLRAYAWLADAELVRGTVLWVREGEVESYTWTRALLDAWAEEVVERVVRWDGKTLYPGRACQYCPRAHECEARTALLRSDIRALSEVMPESIDAMAPDQVLQVVEKARMVSRAADAVLDAVKARVLAHGDVVGESGRLTTEASTRRTVDARKAWPVLESALDISEPERFFAAVTVSWKDVADLARSLAGRGEKKAAVEALEKALADAGALTSTTSHRLVTRR